MAAARRRWLSVTAARDRCYDRAFYSAGLRPTNIALPDGAVVHLWMTSRLSSARRPLLLLHGFGAHATWQWAPFLRPLSSSGFDLFVPDLIFFGRSCSPSLSRSDAYQAHCILSAIDFVLGPSAQILLVGVSYGGFVAHQIAAMRPEAVERVVLVSAGVCIEERDLAEGLFAVRDVREAASLLLPQRPEELKRLVSLTFCRPPRIMPSCFMRDYIEVMCSDHVREKTELLHCLIDGRKLSDLPRITKPTLIIWGDQDRVFPLELAHRLKRHLGNNAELVVMENAGHAINRENPRELCAIIMKYFADYSLKNQKSDEGWLKRVMRRFSRSNNLKRVDSGIPLL